ncbi:MAG: sigma 54-interacting transcriptional regulator [Polyangiaceae bacterium]
MAGEDGTLRETVPLEGAAREALAGATGAAPRRVLVVYHRDGVSSAPLGAGGGVVVGRDAPSDLVIRDASLSRRHARFRVEGGEVVVEDLGSTNGTLVAGERVERAPLAPGDEVTLGAVLASVHVVSAGATRALGLEGHDALRAALDAEAERARFFGRSLALLFVQGPREVHLRRWLDRLREGLRPIDRLALFGPEAVEILLPEVDAEQALEVAAALTARGNGEVELVCGVALFPGSGASADELLEAARLAARRASAAEPVKSAPTEAARTLAPGGGHGPTTDNAAMAEVLETARRVARSRIPVLLSGETGTGKEVMARLIHESGPRKERPMLSVNCGAIAAQLLESALFGHEKGAFTGAGQQHKGVFEAADGGTVLLDEIGELPPAAQVALLRVLESKKVTRVGATREIDVDVRIVAATHRDLEAMVEAGTFRADLLYRLNALTLRIPPLRQRVEDIAPLARRFLAEAAEADGSAVQRISPAAMERLEAYAWPGNVRELKNAIERAVVIAETTVVEVRDLPERVRAAAPINGEAAPVGVAAPGSGSVPPPPPPPEDGETDAAPGDGFKRRVERYEAALIVEALRSTGGSQTEAARVLQLPLRTLQHKIKALGIKRLGWG